MPRQIPVEQDELKPCGCRVTVLDVTLRRYVFDATCEQHSGHKQQVTNGRIEFLKAALES